MADRESPAEAGYQASALQHSFVYQAEGFSLSGRITFDRRLPVVFKPNDR